MPAARKDTRENTRVSIKSVIMIFGLIVLKAMHLLYCLPFKTPLYFSGLNKIGKGEKDEPYGHMVLIIMETGNSLTNRGVFYEPI